MPKKITLLIMMSICACLIAGCMSTTSMGAGSKRKQLILVSQKYEQAKADRSIKKMFGSEGKQIYRKDERRLAGIMNQLIPYANEYLDGRVINWNIHIDYRMKKIQAGAMANGMIIVSGNFFKHPEFTDDDFSLLLAHEMAHVLREHHREKTSWRYIGSPALITTALFSAGTVGLAAGLFHDGYSLSHGRLAEKEADLLGLEIVAKAGFDPERAVQLYIKAQPIFKEQHPISARIPNPFSTHASLKRRAMLSKRHLDVAKQLYANREIKQPSQFIDYNKGLILVDWQEFKVASEPVKIIQ